MLSAIAHHLLTSVQLIPKQLSVPPSQLPPSLWTEIDVLWKGNPFGQFGNLSWPRVPPAFGHLLAGGAGDSEKSLTQGKLSNN